ncbi:MAG: ABC transporter ATP-binding protein [Coriobacteriia bacterium]
MTAAIVLSNVVKSYDGGRQAAVDGLSLVVERGRIVTLLGPSGCGKTTTLRLIAGFERPDAGSVRLGPRTVADEGTWVPAESRGVGMVFQEHALFPHLSVARNVAFNLKGARARTKTAEMLDLVGLSDLADRMPHQLSGGQQQRVALARALAHDPVVVLLDEPFSSLDADLRAQMRTEVRRILKDAGATAVLVSHDQRDALAISDTIVVMRDGTIEQAGPPREIYQFPHTRFVAEFVGTSNVLSGTISGSGSSVETPVGTIPCMHTHGLLDHTEVLVSIRPDSFEIDETGALEGTVVSAVYAGTSTDVTMRVTDAAGAPVDLLVHAHPERELVIGQRIRARVLPDFVAVIEE